MPVAPPLSSSRGLETDGNRSRPAVINTAEDLAAAGARVNTEPSDAQKDSWTYKKAHVKLNGFDISIETPKGAMRRSKASDPVQWENASPAHYGYIKGVPARSPDGEPVDVFVGDNPKSKRIYIVDQRAPSANGRFDEMKIVLGANSIEEARSIYTKAFSDGSGNARLGAISSVTPKALRDLLASPTAARSAYRLGKVPLTEAGFPADARGKVKKPPTLTEFLAAAGGIREDRGELAQMDAGKVFIPGTGKLLRANGRTLDQARALAVENGYLRDAEDGELSTSTVDDLLVALRNDLATRDHFSVVDDDWAGAWRDERGRDDAERRGGDATARAAAELDEIGVEAGDYRERATRLMVEDGLDAADALERAAMEMDQADDIDLADTPATPFFDEEPNALYGRAAPEGGEGSGAAVPRRDGPEEGEGAGRGREAPQDRGEGSAPREADAFDAIFDRH